MTMRLRISKVVPLTKFKTSMRLFSFDIATLTKTCLDTCILTAKEQHVVFIGINYRKDISNIMAGLNKIDACQRFRIPNSNCAVS
jgi:hypothetical protein